MNPSCELFQPEMPKDVQGYELWLDAQQEKQREEDEALFVYLVQQGLVHA